MLDLIVRNAALADGRRGIDVGVAVAIGKRIRRYVQDSHDDGAREINELVSTTPVHVLSTPPRCKKADGVATGLNAHEP